MKLFLMTVVVLVSFSSCLTAAEPQWIWLAEGDRPAGRVYFRKEFEVQGAVTAARLYGACDTVMNVYLDGERVLSHDNWMLPITRTVTEFFVRDVPGGRHVLAVEARNTSRDDQAGLLIKLDLEPAEGATWSVVSDP
jgi:hypothetical protein